MSRTSSSPVVLAVVRPDRIAASWWALARGRELARRRKGELRVLCVVPRRPRARPRRLDALERLLERFTRIVRVGHPTRIAASVAREIGAELVVAGALPGMGGHWARVARRAGVPVLVARPPRKSGVIVAATDFTDEGFPTFASAVRMCSQVAVENARVLLLHNVDPWGRAFTRGFGIVLGERSVKQLRDVREEKIHEIARRAAASIDACALVSGNDDAADAIVEHARRRDADLVVVGAHAPSPFRNGPYRRTANRVVERLGRSALVVPLPPRALELR